MPLTACKQSCKRALVKLSLCLIATGQELLFVTAAVDAQTEMCIWRVLMLPNGDIASGDSSGRVAVWDATYGTLLAAVERHTGDVMALAASPDGSQLFASGMDPKVALIRRLPGQDGRDSKWVYLDCKRPHTHDVRAMEVIVRSDGQEPLIVSGGNDAQLFCYSVNAFQKVLPTVSLWFYDPKRSAEG
jgi:U3 small nucleolar RNA-associated protein 4